MADILIRGLEMPKNCDECWKKYHGFGMVEHDEEWGTFYCKIAKRFCSEIRTKCPLVELPPHGDLIERKELIQIATPVKDHQGTIKFVVWDELWNRIPTIIPASEEVQCNERIH